MSAGFTPDGKQVVAVTVHDGSTGETKVFDVATGLILWRIPTLHNLGVYNPATNRVAIDDVYSRDRIDIWDIAERRLDHTVTGDWGMARSLDWSDDGRYLAFSGVDSSLRVWDDSLRTFIHTWRFDDVIRMVRISPNGRYLYGAFGPWGPVEDAWVWDLRSGEPVMKLHTANYGYFPGFYGQVVFSPDERGVLFAGEDSVRIYQLPDGAQTGGYGYPGFPPPLWISYRAAAFSPNGKQLVGITHSHGYHIWDAETGELLREIDGANYGSLPLIVRYSPDGERLLFGTSYNSLDIWNIADGALERVLIPFSGLDPFHHVAVFNRGDRIAATQSVLHTVIYGLHTGELLATIDHDGAYVNAMDISPDDSMIALAGNGRGGLDSRLDVYDHATGARIRSYPNLGASMRDVHFSPDGTILAACAANRLVLYNAHTVDSSLVIENDAEILLFAFSPDGSTIVTIDAHIRILQWDAGTGAIIREIGAEYDPREMLFSPDGRYLVTCSDDGTIKFHEMESGLPKKQWFFEAPVHDIAFSPDGQYVVFGGEDRILRVVDVEHPWSMHEINDYPEMTGALAVSPDGRYIVVGSYDFFSERSLVVRHARWPVTDVPREAEFTGPRLHEPRPNPASGGRMEIRFSIDRSMRVAIELFDAFGRSVRSTGSQSCEVGMHSVEIDVAGLPSGIYFCALVTERECVTQPLVIAR